MRRMVMAMVNLILRVKGGKEWGISLKRREQDHEE